MKSSAIGNPGQLQHIERITAIGIYLIEIFVRKRKPKSIQSV
jgi:hypothetical protein